MSVQKWVTHLCVGHLGIALLGVVNSPSVPLVQQEEEEFYMLRPVNKTDHMQQGRNVPA